MTIFLSQLLGALLLSLVHLAGAAPLWPTAESTVPDAGGAARMAVDPYDDSTWLLTGGNRIAHVGTSGRVHAESALPGPATAIGIALDQSLWAAGPRELWHLSPSMELLGSRELDRRWTEPVTAIAVDSLGGRTWTVGQTAIGVLDTGGPRRSMTIVDVATAIRDAALDPKTGDFWLLTAAGILAYDATGTLRASIELTATGVDDATGLAYDGAGDAFVLSSPVAMTTIARDGRIGLVITFPEYRAGTPATPFELLPAVSLLRPPGTSTTYERQPVFVLQFGALCNGRACTVPPGYLESLHVSASLDGRPIAGGLRHDPSNAQAVFVPVAPLPPGEHVFTASVVDRFGHVSDTVEATLTIQTLAQTPLDLKANKTPTVTMTAPANNATFAAGATITLAASATDSDGTVKKVEFFRATTLIGTVNAAPWTLAWTNVPAGTYSLTARATDNNNGTKTSKAVAITVTPPPNAPPVIVLTEPANGATQNGPAVTLRASARDADGTIARIDFHDGTTLLGTVAGGAATLDAAWSYADVAGGVHVLKATATDNAGGSASATATITINTAPYAVVTSPAACSEITGPADVTLNADAFDPDGTIARVDFFQGTTLLGSATRAPYRFVWPEAPLGAWAVTAVAVDNLGARRASNPVRFTLRAPDAPPTVSLTAPVAGAQFGVGAVVALAASASDADGTIRRVEFLAGTTLVAAPTSPPFTATWTPATAGSYVLTARAVDDRNVATTSAPVNVAVIKDTAPTIALTAPTGGTKFAAGSTVNLVATAGDSDGTVAKVEFFWGAAGTTPGTLIGTAASPPYTVPFVLANPASTYVLMARATDNLGVRSNSANVTVTTNNPPVVTVNTPGEGSVLGSFANFSVFITAQAGERKLKLVEILASVDGAPVYTMAYCTWPAPTYGMLLCQSPQQRGFSGSVVTLAGRATDDLGATTTSPSVHVTFAGPPTVQITAPADRSAFMAPATIELAATASQTLGRIARVDYYADGTLVASATTPPWAATWSNVPLGAYSLSARATDNLGAAASQSNAQFVYVNPMLLDITAPVDGAELHAGSVLVTGTYAGDVPASIVVNDTPASFGDGRFSTTVPLAAGTNRVYVVAISGRGTTTREIVVTSAPPTVTLTSPQARTSVPAPATFPLAVSLANFDNGVKRVEYRANGNVVASASSPPYAATWTQVPKGNYHLTATAIDQTNQAVTSAAVPVDVEAAIGVTISWPLDNAVLAAGSEYTINVDCRTSGVPFKKFELLRNGAVIVSSNPVPSISRTTYGIPIHDAVIGQYVYTARITDDNDVVTTSAPVHVTVAPRPSVTLLAPRTGKMFAVPGAVTFVATASASIGTIARIDFFADDLLVGTATNPPYAATWSGVPEGTYRLIAVATDSNGATGNSAPVSITVANIALDILAPANGETVHDATTVVSGTFSGDGILQGVTVNGLPAVTGSGTYAATVPLVPGDNPITVQAFIGGQSVTQLVTATRAVPSITITSPASSDTIHDDNVNVEGFVRAGPNSAILVNGRLADVDPAGRFVVNAIPLTAGSNDIAIALNTQEGPGLVQSLTGISSDAVQPFALEVSPDLAFEAPLDVTLTLVDRLGIAFDRIEIAIDGILTRIEAGAVSPQPLGIYAVSLAGAGRHAITVTLFDAQNLVLYRATRHVRIADPAEIDARVRGVLTRTLDRLLAGNVGAAVTAFDEGVQSQYQSLFTELGTNLPSISDKLRGIESVTFGPASAEILVTRTRADGVHAYPIQAVRDGDGIWRLSGM